MELVKVLKSYTNKNGEAKTAVQFYLKLDNGSLIRIEPYKFIKDGKIENSTFKELNLIAKEL